jgi:diaminohydroxyphosphoribosylaminopyrimidine deaminase / 5-amino-6-(5-phosphoribosylamino)uracil reductase
METIFSNEQYMLRCVELARSGFGSTSPNPMVGAVIVHNGKIIGEGYHHKFGEAHAEVNAINMVADKNLLTDSTLFVNLEPCSHFGKTPPCADLIIQHRIPRVVIANEDPNRLVKGNGIEKLKNAGIEVIMDVLKSEGEELNKRFFSYHRKSRPFIILKWAQTEDGFIDVVRHPAQQKKPAWITTEEARMLVHKWRSEEQTILVGTNTAFFDNPKLNVREWAGTSPIRIVIDRTLRLPQNLNLFDGSVSTIIFTQEVVEEQDNPNIEYITIPFDEYLPEHILGGLYRKKVQSLIIEGGTKLINSFLEANLWDEARVFTGSKYFIAGIDAPKLESSPMETEAWSDFRLDIFRNTY